MSDLNHYPSYDTEATDKYSVLRAQFGEGYAQAMPDGINPVREVWNLVYDPIDVDTVETLRTFFRSHVGGTFTWTRQGGSEKTYEQVGDVTFKEAGLSGWLRVTIQEAFR